MKAVVSTTLKHADKIYAYLVESLVKGDENTSHEPLLVADENPSPEIDNLSHETQNSSLIF